MRRQHLLKKGNSAMTKHERLIDSSHSTQEKDEKSSWRETMKLVQPYSVYVLIMLLVAYLLNQLDRYMLAITVKPMAQEIHFGDLACLTNSSYSDVQTANVTCKSAKSQLSCVNQTNTDGDAVCEWNYNGEGLQYQLVAGPVFIVIYTFMGIFLGFAADIYNRKVILAVCLIFWSVMTLLTGFIEEYWQLVILRFGLGIGEAGCTPFAASLIADYFVQEARGAALGVYNWGIYLGYSMSYAIGNFITVANINGQGWRWAFIISGIPGLLFGVIILLTVKEPERSKPKQKDGSSEQQTQKFTEKLKEVLKSFLRPSLLMIFIAGSIRNAAGYVWAYNTQPYFNAIDQSKEEIASYMSWIPIVGGSLGVVVGGFISDRFVKTRGLYARVVVLCASQILAAPFAAGTLFFDPPWAYVCQIPTYIIGEMWIGVALAVMVELVPVHIRTAAVAVYLFVISNIGGNMPLLVPPIQSAFSSAGHTKAQSLRGALYILYPGLYVISSLLFLLTVFVIKSDQKAAQQKNYREMVESKESITS